MTEGTLKSEELKKDVMKFLRANLASYKRPKFVDFVDALPKTTSGKVRRSEVRESDWSKEKENAN